MGLADVSRESSVGDQESFTPVPSAVNSEEKL